MPRGRGRGRGGRGASASGRGASKFGRPSLPASRKLTRHFSNTSARSTQFVARRGSNDHVYATYDRPLLVISGLRRQDSSNSPFESGDEDESRSQSPSLENSDDPDGSDYERYNKIRPPPPPAEPENGDDWTEIEEEVVLEPPRRGFYRPPPTKQVIVKRVRRSEIGEGQVTGSPTSNTPKANSSDGNGSQRKSRSAHSNRGLRRSLDETNAQDDDIAEETVRYTRRQEELEDLPQLDEEDEEEEEDVPHEIIDEGELSDSEFPAPFLERPPSPNEADCDDRADYILKKRFAPMSDPQTLINALTKHPAASRDTKLLYQLALNTQEALRAWQDEYLMLDLRTAPNTNPPKKPVTGARIPLDHQVWEDMKEAELYGYLFDPKKTGHQDPFAQRIGGGDFVGGRALRHRRGARDIGGEASEDDGEGTDAGGKRKRRAVQRWDGEPVASGRGRKRGFESRTPDVEGPPKKRGRPSAAERSLLHNKIRQLREESAAVNTASEGDSQSPERRKRRGRPPGSKNQGPRSDAGVKKGPRKSKGLTWGTFDPSSANGTPDDRRSTPASYATPNMSTREDRFDQGGLEQSVEYPQQESTGHAPLSNPRPLSLENLRPFIQASQTGAYSSPSTSGQPEGETGPEKKKRVKSEKRSQSMTIWWAARKQRDAEVRKEQLAQQKSNNRFAEQQHAERHPAPQMEQPQQHQHQVQQSPYAVVDNQRFWNNMQPQQQPQMMPEQQQQQSRSGGPTGPPHVEQYQPPPLLMRNTPTQNPSQPRPGPRGSPLKKIINYVSDPTAAAQAHNPPYQTIMTPGAGSPIMLNQPQSNQQLPPIHQRPNAGPPPHQGYQMMMIPEGGNTFTPIQAPRPSEYGQNPPPPHLPQSPRDNPHGQHARQASQHEMHQQSHQPHQPAHPPQSSHGHAKSNSSNFSGFSSFSSRPPPAPSHAATYSPGTGSYRPPSVPPASTQQSSGPAPGRQLAPLAPSGKMTGAQVQDLHLAQVQPVQRRPIEFVLQQQQQQQAQQHQRHPSHPGQQQQQQQSPQQQQGGQLPQLMPPYQPQNPMPQGHYQQQGPQKHNQPPQQQASPQSQYLPPLAPAPPTHGQAPPPPPPLLPAFSQAHGTGPPIAPAPPPQQQQQQPGAQPAPPPPPMRFVEMHGDGRRGGKK